MQRSTDRILTTHTGSLPRPRELTQLYWRRAHGEAVDEAEIERLGRNAVQGVVARQRAAGIDLRSTANPIMRLIRALKMTLLFAWMLLDLLERQIEADIALHKKPELGNGK